MVLIPLSALSTSPSVVSMRTTAAPSRMLLDATDE
jgi:hypothetical protein